MDFDLNFHGQTGSCTCKLARNGFRHFGGNNAGNEGDRMRCRWMAMNDDRDGEQSRGKGGSERGFLGREVERRGSLHTPQSLPFNHACAVNTTETKPPKDGGLIELDVHANAWTICLG